MTGLTPEQITNIMNTDVSRQNMMTTRASTINSILNNDPEINAELKRSNIKLAEAQTAAQYAGAEKDRRWQPTYKTPPGWDEQIIVDPDDSSKGAVYRVNKQDPTEREYMGQATPKQMRENVTGITENQLMTRRQQWSAGKSSLIEQVHNTKNTLEESHAAARSFNEEQLRGSRQDWADDSTLYYTPKPSDDRWALTKWLGYGDDDPLVLNKEPIPVDIGRFKVDGTPLTLQDFDRVRRKSKMSTQQLIEYLFAQAGIEY